MYNNSNEADDGIHSKLTSSYYVICGALMQASIINKLDLNKLNWFR